MAFLTFRAIYQGINLWLGIFNVLTRREGYTTDKHTKATLFNCQLGTTLWAVAILYDLKRGRLVVVKWFGKMTRGVP